MDQSIKFWDRIADRYAKKPVANEDEYQRKISISQRYLSPDMQVLEFGFGTGSTALLHAPKVAHYTAIDLAPNMIRIAREKLINAGIRNLDFEVATLNDFQEKHQAYDALLGLNILHLLEDPAEAINHAYKLLKPGGVFITSTACLGDKMNYFRYLAPIGRFFRIIPLVRVFKRVQLESYFEAAGFNIDYRWVPENSPLVYFMVARKPD